MSPNWVKARAECNLELTFEALFGIVERDVNEANDIDAFVSYRLEIQRGVFDPMISVTREDNGSFSGRVIFTQMAHEIRVCRESPMSAGKENLFSVTAQWEEDNHRCRLFVDGSTLEVWELSRKALEPMFFPGQGSS